MAVDAKQFPVAAVLRVIIMIMIFVMNSQLSQALTTELAPAAGTDPGMDLEGFRPIA